MSRGALLAFATRELATRATPEAVAFAGRLAAERRTAAVLYYGSTLRTGDLGGLLDYYVLTDGPHRRGLRGLVERKLWPEVSYREFDTAAGTLRAKVATMPLDTFRRAASGRTLDTTIWARFVQPVALVWRRDETAAGEVAEAVAAAARTAARFAAAVGPEEGSALDYWRALFRQTYRAELRVETAGRADEILRVAPERWTALMPLAWAAGGIEAEQVGEAFRPQPGARRRRRLLARWRLRRTMGKPLNVARLIKAAFTFDGASRYAVWKIERHTGLKVPLTPFRERHPILSAPGVLWLLWRARKRGPAA
ncbi:hypothetical protein [Phenylobacterium sp.]|uniref:hypothetical protein n=1 Tax=Phenylobacterium sp. TaxID=1871053 RepID=UPI003782E5D9